MRIDKEGIHFEHKPAEAAELRVSELRGALYTGRCLGQSSEAILHLDSKLRFSCLLLGREPYNRGELLRGAEKNHTPPGLTTQPRGLFSFTHESLPWANFAVIAFARRIRANGLLVQQLGFFATSSLGLYRAFWPLG